MEKLSTDLARRFDLIRVEDLRMRNMTRSAKGTVDAPGTNVWQKAGLNRAILDQGWGVLVTRLEQQAPGRVEQVNAAYTSQRCRACGYTAAESRESQARFGCRSCGHTAHADLNAARNIAAGHAGTARGGPALAGPVNREPQHASLRVAQLESQSFQGGEDVKAPTLSSGAASHICVRRLRPNPRRGRQPSHGSAHRPRAAPAGRPSPASPGQGPAAEPTETRRQDLERSPLL